LTAQVFIHINIWHAITMGIPFSYASKPSFSTHNLRADVTNSDSPDSQLRQPPLTKSIISHFKQKLTWIITPGNNFGFLPPECFSKVEFITIKRKVLWTSDEGGAVLEQEPKYMASPKTKRTTSKKDLDQFFDFPKYRRRVVHSDLKKEARAIFSA
jgi:hypothetical protein